MSIFHLCCLSSIFVLYHNVMTNLYLLSYDKESKDYLLEPGTAGWKAQAKSMGYERYPITLFFLISHCDPQFINTSFLNLNPYFFFLSKCRAFDV